MSLLLLTTALLAQDISWQPATPRQGSLIVVSAPGAITGQLAGEPLHFRRGKALAAVPLSATDSIRLETLSIGWGGEGGGGEGNVRVGGGGGGGVGGGRLEGGGWRRGPGRGRDHPAPRVFRPPPPAPANRQGL